MIDAVVRAVARRSPWPGEVAPSAELRDALAALDTDLDGRTVVRASHGAVLWVAVLCLPVLAVVPPSSLPTASAVIAAVAVGAGYAVRRGPVALAATRRAAALGAGPGLVGRAVLRMRIEPTSEAAAAFAARTGTGPLAASLRDHIRRSRNTPQSGFVSFAAEWAAWDPALRRAVLLLEAAADEPPAERERTLDRALATVLDGARNRAAEFAARIRGPTTALYAFGVLLPLALVAVAPAARVAGLPLSLPAIVVVYDLLLPAALVAASGWLLAERPVAFPPSAVSAAHPDLPDDRRGALVGTCAVGVAAWSLAPFALPAWTRWLAALGFAVGVGAVWWFRPVAAIRSHARAVEEHLTDALALVGHRVTRGESVELAVAGVADETPGETGAMLADADRVRRQLGTGIDAAFLGEHGALADVPSQRTRSAAALLAIAAREGRPAGAALVTTADHVDDLRQVERDARHELAHVTGTLRNTAAVFAPLVAGATVALADGMAGAGGDLGAAIPTGALGLAVGVYVLLLAAILSALATALEHGFDRALVGSHVGQALAAATAVYLTSFVGAGLLV